MDINLLLKYSNLRVTKARKLILEKIIEVDRPISAEDIHESLKNNKEYINLSTIYRNLNALSDNNILIINTDLDGISYFQLNVHDHKHFITCLSCGKKVLIEDCPIEEISHDLEKSTGFTIKGHNFEFTGICPECQKKGEN
jgi:Fur family ferric uptake transcriptional regulator